MAKNYNYERPRTEVYQLLNQEVSLYGNHSHACILGSQYDLYRHGKESLTPTPFSYKDNDTESTVNITVDRHIPGVNYKLDTENVDLFAEDILCILGNAVEATYGDSPVRIKAPTDTYWSVTDPSQYTNLAVKDSNSTPNTYEVSVGDIVLLDTTASTAAQNSEETSTSKRYAKVTALKSSQDNGNYDILVLDTLLLDLSVAGTTVPVEGNKIKIKIGKLYSTSLKALGVKVTADEANSKIKYKVPATIELPITSVSGNRISSSIESGVGRVYPEYRVRVTYNNDSIIRIDSLTQLQNQLGTIDPDNELAYGCYRALSGGEGYSVYAVRTTGDDAKAYAEAIAKTEANTQVYAFVPLTSDTEALQYVVDFNETLSSPQNKKWRITMIGASFEDGQSIKYDPKGTKLNASSETTGNAKEAYVQISDNNVDNGFSFKSYGIGDIISSITTSTSDDGEGNTITTETSTEEGVITEIISNNFVKIETKDDFKDFADSAIKITVQNTITGNIEYVTSLAQKFNNRRVVVVWCDNGTSGGVKMHNAYIAAEIAGMTSRYEPQAGLTQADITTIDAAPNMYSKYSQGDLDEIAAHGVLIVTQDNEAQTPYIRHQLTTCADKGILYRELSCTRNIDNISYKVADAIKPYIGRANVVPSALTSLRIDLHNIWDTCLANATDPLVGPQLYAYRDDTIQQDPLGLDRVIVNVTYDIPAPLNYIGVWQEVYVAEVSI